MHSGPEPALNRLVLQVEAAGAIHNSGTEIFLHSLWVFLPVGVAKTLQVGVLLLVGAGHVGFDMVVRLGVEAVDMLPDCVDRADMIKLRIYSDALMRGQSLLSKDLHYVLSVNGADGHVIPYVLYDS